MKASRSWLTLLGPGLLLYLLPLVLKVTGLRSVDGGHSYPESYKGVVGGNVSFYCPVDKTKNLDFLYFQKVVVIGEQIFFNGYHSKPLKPQPRTEMDQSNTIMHIYELTSSDSGEYECHYMYKDDQTVNTVKIHLSVTALFSKPVITNNCNQANGIPLECEVKCEAHNGFPNKKIKWNELRNISKEMWNILRNNEVPTKTELVNISSTASFNCSVGELKVSCSVDGITSDIISVCYSKASPDQSANLIIVIAAVVCVLVGIAILCVFKFKKRTTEAENTRSNGHPEEVRVLNNLGS
ncbi:CD276 antigen homolog [Girardinichthys multiradiatus]|uniref:CD276 antigen homolog n=1 Tax=Girardinichthys multiradiatus TaxID=208333 RepID=UPI001FAD7A8C|nr:CD276 antigen homolog [Girardinichthys multiradiatus]